MKKKRKHTFIANFLLMDFNKYSILSWDRAKTAARIVRVSLGYIDRMCVERCVRCAMYMDTRKRVDWLLFDKCTRKCTFFFRVPLKTSEEMYIDTEIRRRFFYSPYYHYLSSMHNERSTRISFGCSSSIYARFYVIMQVDVSVYRPELSKSMEESRGQQQQLAKTKGKYMEEAEICVNLKSHRNSPAIDTNTHMCTLYSEICMGIINEFSHDVHAAVAISGPFFSTRVCCCCFFDIISTSTPCSVEKCVKSKHVQ